MSEQSRRSLAYAIAQLRHAYVPLFINHVTDQRGLAKGLIAPQIERLEAIARELDEAEKPRQMTPSHPADTPYGNTYGGLLQRLNLMRRAQGLQPLGYGLSDEFIAGIVEQSK